MLKFAAIALVLVATSAPSFANPGSADDQRACTPDVFRLCSSSIPDVAKITACLRAKKDQLSPACKAVFNRK